MTYRNKNTVRKRGEQSSLAVSTKYGSERSKTGTKNLNGELLEQVLEFLGLVL